MAGAKQQPKKSSATLATNGMSWKYFFIALSVAANIGFVVVIVTMMTSHVLDGMFINEGLTRYCAAVNDDKFAGAEEEVKALRAYTCATGDAQTYFESGFQSYLDYKNIK